MEKFEAAVAAAPEEGAAEGEAAAEAQAAPEDGGEGDGSALTGLSDDQEADEVPTAVVAFDGLLSGTDTDVQQSLDTLDDVDALAISVAGSAVNHTPTGPTVEEWLRSMQQELGGGVTFGYVASPTQAGTKGDMVVDETNYAWLHIWVSDTENRRISLNVWEAP